jgi:hypothetical protein
MLGLVGDNDKDFHRGYKIKPPEPIADVCYKFSSVWFSYIRPSGIVG